MLVVDFSNNRIRQITPEGVVTNVIVVTAYDMTRYPAIEGNALSIGAGNLGSVVRMPNGDVYFTDVWNPGSWDTACGWRAFPKARSGRPPSLQIPHRCITESRHAGPAGRLRHHPCRPQQPLQVHHRHQHPDPFVGKVGVNGYADGTGTNATFTGIVGIYFDTNGDILVNQNSGAIRRVTLQGVVTTIFPLENDDANIIANAGQAIPAWRPVHAYQ